MLPLWNLICRKLQHGWKIFEPMFHVNLITLWYIISILKQNFWLLTQIKIQNKIQFPETQNNKI